jgi:hypothetical protein
LAEARARRRRGLAWFSLVLGVVVGVLAASIGEWPGVVVSVGLGVVAGVTLYGDRAEGRGRSEVS